MSLQQIYFNKRQDGIQLLRKSKTKKKKTTQTLFQRQHAFYKCVFQVRHMCEHFSITGFISPQYIKL